MRASSRTACSRSCATARSSTAGRLAGTRPSSGCCSVSARRAAAHALDERLVVPRKWLPFDTPFEACAWLDSRARTVPRRHADIVLTTSQLFDGCEPRQPCCSISRSEDLLALALRRAGRWHHEPFGVDILRGAQHAQMRNAGCMQPAAMGFSSFEQCRSIIYGPQDGAGYRGGGNAGNAAFPARPRPLAAAAAAARPPTRVAGRDHAGHRLPLASARVSPHKRQSPRGHGAATLGRL